MSSKGTDSLPPADCGWTGRWPAGPGSFSSYLHSPPALEVERFKILGEPQAALGRRTSLGHRPSYPLQGPPNADTGASRHAHRLPPRTLVLRLGQSGSSLSSKPDPSAPVHGGSGFLTLSRAEEPPKATPAHPMGPALADARRRERALWRPAGVSKSLRDGSPSRNPSWFPGSDEGIMRVWTVGKRRDSGFSWRLTLYFSKSKSRTKPNHYHHLKPTLQGQVDFRVLTLRGNEQLAKTFYPVVP